MLQFITNALDEESIIKQVDEVLTGGCKWVQLRMKDSSVDDIKNIAQAIKPMCKEKEAILVVDDHVMIAKELMLDGVHLGKMDMNPTEAREILGEEFIIGATANTFDDVVALSKIDVDYIGIGPFKYTTTKKNLSPILGIEGYKSIMIECAKANIKIPVVAVGGIEYADINDIMDTGVNGVAISSGITNSQNPEEITKEIIILLNKIINERFLKSIN